MIIEHVRYIDQVWRIFFHAGGCWRVDCTSQITSFSLNDIYQIFWWVGQGSQSSILDCKFVPLICNSAFSTYTRHLDLGLCAGNFQNPSTCDSMAVSRIQLKKRKDLIFSFGAAFFLSVNLWVVVVKGSAPE